MSVASSVFSQTNSVNYVIPIKNQTVEPTQVIEGSIENKMLMKKYFVLEQTCKEEGIKSDHLYNSVDMTSAKKTNLVIKMSSPLKQNIGNDIEILNKIKWDNVPTILDTGVFICLSPP